MNDYPIVPGRGLNTNDAKKYRLDFLREQGIEVPLIANTSLDEKQIRHNIESYIGTVEIPIGLVGPLLFNDKEKSDYVYAPVGTLEGALVASINRGAKVLSKSGGFNAYILHQKMLRSPMFIFKNIGECVVFKNWVEDHFKEIKTVAEQYSNHARLQEINAFIAGRSVHLKFIYTTGDASGQNMTTTCTSHAMQWMVEQLKSTIGLEPVQFVIEGNAASDKKVSHYSLQQGRGIHVVAECALKEHEIQKTLRVNSEDLLRALNQSQLMSRMDGMLGYNINVTNAIAAIFVATGQDLASIHESGIGILNMEKTDDGLYCTLHLPGLVIGTVGGGTQLPMQQEALAMMGCAGSGKVERFAKLIAGFALSLELSTFAAIVGGQFAKVHEKLGRNKPIEWLLKAEIDKAFLTQNLKTPYRDKLMAVHFLERALVENGLIINLTSKFNNKITGFVPLELVFKYTESAAPKSEQVLLKSKPLDAEVFQGLHYMAASIDPVLADLIMVHQPILEFKNCHLKETQVYQLLSAHQLQVMPLFYGHYENTTREIYTLVIELLQESELALFNTENQPILWQEEHIKAVITTISEVHQVFSELDKNSIPPTITCYEPWRAKALFTKFASIIALEYEDAIWHDRIPKLLEYIEELEDLHQAIKLPKTIIHNDFNPRNIAIRKGGAVCIYDWELAMYDFPHRDIVEFLSFVLPEDFDSNTLLSLLKYHYALQKIPLPWEDWKAVYIYSLKTFLVGRITFYLTGKIIMNYQFTDRIFTNAFRMIDMLIEEKIISQSPSIGTSKLI
jgi:hydroxymethylglutaryl-CoA reductase (NADPH)